MSNEENKTKRCPDGPYLYFPGLSYRSTAKALSRFVHRSHVSVWKRVQKHKPERVSSKRKKTDGFIVGETLVKIGSGFIWLWVAIEPKDKEFSQQAYPETQHVASRTFSVQSFGVTWTTPCFNGWWHMVSADLQIHESKASHAFPFGENLD